MELLIFIITLIICILSAILFTYSAFRNRAENEKIKEISEAIKESSGAFAKKELMILLAVSAVIFILFGIFLSWKIALSFLLGALLSTAGLFAGTKIAVKANSTAAESADESITKPLRIMFSAGMAAGLSAVVLSIVGVIIINYFSNNLFLFYSLGFGVSVTALLSGITRSTYSNAAKAPCTEKISASPSAIASCAGENINNALSALPENLVLAVIAAMAVAFMQFEGKAGTLPAAIVLSGMLCSVIGSFLARTKKEERVKSSLRNSFFAAAILQMIALYYIVGWYTGLIGLFYSVISGVIGGIILLLLAEFYFQGKERALPAGLLSSSFESAFLPLLATAAVIFVSYYFGGAFGIAIAAVGMLSVVSMNIASGIFSGIACNANSIAAMAGLGNKVKNRAQSLESAGITSAAGGRVLAVCSALLVVISLLAVYANDIQKLAKSAADITGITGQSAVSNADAFSLSLTSPAFFIGLVLGAGVIFLFCSLMIKAAEKTSLKIAEEAKRQFTQIKGLAKGTAKADYSGCSTKAFNSAAVHSLLPVLLVIVSPAVICFVLGLEALSGMLISIFTICAGLGLVINYNTSYLKQISALALMSALKFMAIISLLMLPVFFRIIG